MGNKIYPKPWQLYMIHQDDIMSSHRKSFQFNYESTVTRYLLLPSVIPAVYHTTLLFC